MTPSEMSPLRIGTARTVRNRSMFFAPYEYSGSAKTSGTWIARRSSAARAAALCRPGRIGFRATKSFCPGEALKPATIRSTWPSKRKTNPRSAPHSLPVLSARVSNTASKSDAERLMTSSNLEVAVCCSSDSVKSIVRWRSSLSRHVFSMAMAACSARASSSSRAWRLSCSCRSAMDEPPRRTAVGAFLRFSLAVPPCCVFAGLRLVVRRGFTEPSHGPTTVRYHIMRCVVRHRKIPLSIGSYGSTIATGRGKL
jgi:hypothetical protein